MLDIKFIRENIDLIQQTCTRKRAACDIDTLLELDEKRRNTLAEVEDLRNEMNTASKSISKLTGNERQTQIDKMKEVKDGLKDKETALLDIMERFDALMLRVPNPPHESVPDGKDENDNIEVKKWGTPREFDFAFKDHMTLMENLDMVDMKRAALKISGARTYFLKNEGARLEMAVLNYTLDKLIKKGFTPFIVPALVNYAAMMGTSYFPGGEEQAYHLDERDDMYLIGTAEVPVTSYHRDEILKLEELPKKYCGISPCFRREAGTYGKDTHGLYRIHQFQKVEQVIICQADPEESRRMHELILGNAEEVLQDLELAYRVVIVCAGDMGQGQVFKNDIETWMPSRKSYCETHSCSTFHDFQARRLKMRYKDENGKIHFCHTLNNTCIASPRILIPLTEVHQNEDGSITIPKVLRDKYFDGQEMIGPK